MTIPEKLKAIAAADTNLSALISGRFHYAEAPEKPGVPYVVYSLQEDTPVVHNSSAQEMRAWKLYLYAVGASPLLAHNLARQLKATFTLYKESEPGASDTDIQAITIDTGMVDLERTAIAKEYPCSLILDVWEQLV